MDCLKIFKKKQKEASKEQSNTNIVSQSSQNIKQHQNQQNEGQQEEVKGEQQQQLTEEQQKEERYYQKIKSSININNQQIEINFQPLFNIYDYQLTDFIDFIKNDEKYQSMKLIFSNCQIQSTSLLVLCEILQNFKDILGLNINFVNSKVMYLQCKNTHEEEQKIKQQNQNFSNLKQLAISEAKEFSENKFPELLQNFSYLQTLTLNFSNTDSLFNMNFLLQSVLNLKQLNRFHLILRNLPKNSFIPLKLQNQNNSLQVFILTVNYSQKTSDSEFSEIFKFIQLLPNLKKLELYLQNTKLSTEFVILQIFLQLQQQLTHLVIDLEKSSNILQQENIYEDIARLEYDQCLQRNLEHLCILMNYSKIENHVINEGLLNQISGMIKLKKLEISQQLSNQPGHFYQDFFNHKIVNLKNLTTFNFQYFQSLSESQQKQNIQLKIINLQNLFSLPCITSISLFIQMYDVVINYINIMFQNQMQDLIQNLHLAKHLVKFQLQSYELFFGKNKFLEPFIQELFKLKYLLYFGFLPAQASPFLKIEGKQIESHRILIKKLRARKSILTLIQKIRVTKLMKIWRRDITFEMIEFY